MKLKYSFLALLLAALPGSPAAPATAGFDSEAEAEILEALNHSRAQAGAPELKLDERLREAARRHTALLVEHNAMSHQFSDEPPLNDRLRAAGSFFTAAAENIGLNSQLEDVNSMFLRSPGHRTNMLNPSYNAAGIGVIHRGRDYWVTEDFAELTPSLSAQQAEDQAAATFEAKWKRNHAVMAQRVAIETLRSFACQMAKSGGSLPKTTITYQGKPVREVAAFSTADPSSLAHQIDSVVENPHIRAYAIGACTPEQSGSYGQFWIAMAFF